MSAIVSPRLSDLAVTVPVDRGTISRHVDIGGRVAQDAIELETRMRGE